ncbi:hypothetical protein Lal_00031097 [Lupinus albus]|nr:hypothetical protein Lal_00031097 [Lupinus albus]
MKGHNPTGCSLLPEGNINYHSATAQYRNPAVPAVSEGGNALGNIVAAADLQHVAPKRVGDLLGYNNRSW